ncbi:hypothetical protein JCM30237_06980 [Halolamina litorea]|uniref:DUF952 domain-containing protein n=1 Tax=Halolamina litorea TaxID=1515593 RepID=A0ABD6BPN1_9EURY|nr:DUF952 domain-containing protein [Halolamina litorea]
MPVIMHALPEADWAAAERAGEYRPASLDEEGFIPLQDPADIVAHTNERYAREERDDIGVFAVRSETLGDALRYEDIDGGRRPRLYGSVAPDGVAMWGHFPRDRHGFHLPEWAVDLVAADRLPEEANGEFR